MKLWRGLILIAQGIVTIPTLLAVLSPVISPMQFSLPGLFALVLPFLLLAQIFFLLYWLIKWRWPALISLVVIILAIPAIDRMVQIGYSSRVQDERAFQLISYNQHNLREFTEMEGVSEDEAQDMWKGFERSVDGFDIMAFQEFGHVSTKFFKLKKDYPYLVQCDLSSDIRIYSKYKILQSGCIDLVQERNQALWADVLLPPEKSVKGKQDTIRIYNFHLASNKISHISTEMAEQQNLDPEYIYTNMRVMFSRYKQYAPTRIKELGLIMEHSMKTELPTIFCGDFNEIPQSYLYRLVADKYHDSFIRRGRGFGDTYAAEIPFLRIDYIFTSSDFEVMSYTKGKEVPFSDHHPVVASLRMKVDK